MLLSAKSSVSSSSSKAAVNAKLMVSAADSSSPVGKEKEDDDDASAMDLAEDSGEGVLSAASSSSSPTLEIEDANCILRKIEEENKTLKHELSVESKAGRSLYGKGATKEMDGAQKQIESYVKKIEREKIRRLELDSQLELLGRRLEEKRKEAVQTSKTRVLQAVRHGAKVTEKKLEHAITKHNEMIAFNKNLKDKVGALRRERVVLDAVYKQLEIDILETRMRLESAQDKLKLIEQNNELIQQSITELKTIAEQQEKTFKNECGELTQSIEHDRDQQAVKAAALMEEQRTRNEGKKADEQVAVSSTEDPTQQKKQILRYKWQHVENETTVELTREKIAKYEEAFAKIRAITGVSDIAAIVDQFIEEESKNFSLVTHIAELSNESRRLKSQIEKVKTEVEELRQPSASSTEKTPPKLSQSFKKGKKGLDVHTTIQEQAASIAEKNNLMQQLVSSIHRIATHIGAEETVADLGAFGGLGGQVTESNVLEWLSVVEKKTAELLLRKAQGDKESSKYFDRNLEMRGVVHSEALIGQGPSHLHGEHVRLAIQPPSLDENLLEDPTGDYSAIDRPLSREELAKSTARRLKQAAAGKRPPAKATAKTPQRTMRQSSVPAIAEDSESDDGLPESSTENNPPAGASL